VLSGFHGTDFGSCALPNMMSFVWLSLRAAAESTLIVLLFNVFCIVIQNLQRTHELYGSWVRPASEVLNLIQIARDRRTFFAGIGGAEAINFLFPPTFYSIIIIDNY